MIPALPRVPSWVVWLALGALLAVAVLGWALGWWSGLAALLGAGAAAGAAVPARLQVPAEPPPAPVDVVDRTAVDLVHSQAEEEHDEVEDALTGHSPTEDVAELLRRRRRRP